MNNACPRLPPPPPFTLFESDSDSELEDLERNHPELLKSMQDEISRADELEGSGIVYTPTCLRDTTEATCYTKYEDFVYTEHANLVPSGMFKVLNPSSGKVDKEYTTNVMKRYCKNQSDSSVTALATTFDDVLGTFVAKHREDIGESSQMDLD